MAGAASGKRIRNSFSCGHGIAFRLFDSPPRNVSAIFTRCPGDLCAERAFIRKVRKENPQRTQSDTPDIDL
jgi:hypothetical protein